MRLKGKNKPNILKISVVLLILALIISCSNMKTISSSDNNYSMKIPKQWAKVNNHPFLKEIDQMFGIVTGKQEEKNFYADKRNLANALFLYKMKIPQEYVDLTTEALIDELGMSNAVRNISIKSKVFFMVAEQLDLDYIVMGAFTKNADTFYSFITIFNNSDLISSNNISKYVEKMFESIKFKNPEKQSEEKSRLAIAELRKKERLELEIQQQRKQAELQAIQDRIIALIDIRLEELREKEQELRAQTYSINYYDAIHEVVIYIQGFEYDKAQIKQGNSNIFKRYSDITDPPLNPSNVILSVDPGSLFQN
jgi:hypothetical protein